MIRITDRVRRLLMQWAGEFLFRTLSPAQSAVSRPPSLDPSERSDPGADAIASLKSFLRRFPYWGRGHLALAQRAFAVNDIATAYASLQAARAVAPYSGVDADCIDGGLARCYARRGDLGRAERALLTIVARRPDLIELQEDLASVYMATSRREDARILLEKIPASRLSPEGQAALSFLRNAS